MVQGSPLLHPARSRIAAERLHLHRVFFQRGDGLLERGVGVVAGDFEEETGLGVAGLAASKTCQVFYRSRDS